MNRPEVWALFATRDRSASSDLRNQVSRICTDRDWHFEQRAAVELRDSRGRPISILEPDISNKLYRRVHRTRVAVLAVGKIPSAALHPDVDTVVKSGRSVSVRDFVAYKAFWTQLQPEATRHSWADAFSAWAASTICDGEHDPRCLPFHIFKADANNLDSAPARAQFNDRYGAGARRRSDDASMWILKPGVFHGQEVLNVAGYDLRAGYHWDMNAQSMRVATPASVWWVNSYINVYPDGHLRGTGTYAKKLSK